MSYTKMVGHRALPVRSRGTEKVTAKLINLFRRYGVYEKQSDGTLRRVDGRYSFFTLGAAKQRATRGKNCTVATFGPMQIKPLTLKQ